MTAFSSGPHGFNGSWPRHAPGARSAATVRPLTNEPSFDAIVEENLRQGFYLAQRDALTAVARDPRCTRRHVRVHAEIVARMNSKTGMAYPGWATIAADAATLPGGIIDPDGEYDAATINNITSDLRRWGYLASAKRGPEGGGRAIAHYTVARPSVEQLQREITKWIEKARARDRLDALEASRADFTNARDVSKGADLTGAGEVSNSDLTRGRAADLTCGRVTVTCIMKEPVEEALAAYNEAAEMHGFSQCRTLTDARRKRIEKRLKDIGGGDAFRRALTALPLNEFLMGRVRPKPGQTPFRLDLDRLLQTDGNLGDVLARLIDAAGDSPRRDLTREEEVQALQEKNPDVPVEQVEQAVIAARRSRGLD